MKSTIMILTIMNSWSGLSGSDSSPFAPIYNNVSDITIDIKCGSGLRINNVTLYGLSNDFLFIIDNGNIRKIFLKWITEIHIPKHFNESNKSYWLQMKRKMNALDSKLFYRSFFDVYNVSKKNQLEKIDSIRNIVSEENRNK